MDKEASRLEETFVYEVYDNIAGHFDQTRHSQWTGVKRFLSSLAPYSLVLDAGCGNGKYLIADRLVKMGCDRSIELCKICNDKGFSVFAADCLALPLTEGRFDAVLSIAVIHHFVTEERRSRALNEILSLLRPGGRALIYVWAFEQRRKGESSFYLKNDRTNQECSPADGPSLEQIQIDENTTLPVHDNRTQFRAQDLLVPWTRQRQKKDLAEESEDSCPERLLRFYHVFKEGELERLCSELGGCHVKQSFYEQGNWCVELERT